MQAAHTPANSNSKTLGGRDETKTISTCSDKLPRRFCVIRLKIHWNARRTKIISKNIQIVSKNGWQIKSASKTLRGRDKIKTSRRPLHSATSYLVNWPQYVFWKNRTWTSVKYTKLPLQSASREAGDKIWFKNTEKSETGQKCHSDIYVLQ